MITKVHAGPAKIRVTFSMPSAIWADTIHLVGDFNNWSKTATPLRLSDAGWMVSLVLPEGEAYQYRYLVNGEEWHNDWHADGYRRNEFGGDSSVVITRIAVEEPLEVVEEPELLELEAGNIVHFPTWRLKYQRKVSQS